MITPWLFLSVITTTYCYLFLHYERAPLLVSYTKYITTNFRSVWLLYHDVQCKNVTSNQGLGKHVSLRMKKTLAPNKRSELLNLKIISNYNLQFLKIWNLCVATTYKYSIKYYSTTITWKRAVYILSSTLISHHFLLTTNTKLNSESRASLSLSRLFSHATLAATPALPQSFLPNFLQRCMATESRGSGLRRLPAQKVKVVSPAGHDGWWVAGQQDGLLDVLYGGPEKSRWGSRRRGKRWEVRANIWHQQWVGGGNTRGSCMVGCACTSAYLI